MPEAVNRLISLLDSGKDNTAFHRDTCDVVVNTCGPADRSRKTLASTQKPRRKMDSVAFVEARDTFARTCPPR
jgi:hypothetical protein